jgi:CDP-diacylglycerol--serine O-phosphatidyltransferase
VLIFTFVAARPAEVLLAVFGLYAISGPFITIKTVKKLKLEHVVGDDDADFNDKANKDNEK